MSFVQVAISASNAFQQVQAGKYAKSVADTNAGELDYQGQLANQNALQTANVIRRAGRRQVGQATAAYGASGVQVGAGSAGLVEEGIRQDVEHDAYQALLEGKRRANGLQTEADLTRIDGGMRAKAGELSAIGTVMGGMYKAGVNSGWRTGGAPGFSGTQAPAPVTDLSSYSPGTRRY